MKANDIQQNHKVSVILVSSSLVSDDIVTMI